MTHTRFRSAHRRTYTFCFSVVLSFAAFGHAHSAPERLLEYQSLGGVSVLDPSFAHPQILEEPLEMGSGLDISGSSTFNSRRWDITSHSFDDAFAANDYWSFGFASTQAITLDSLSIRLDRSSTGPDDIEMRALWGQGHNATLLRYDFEDRSSGVDIIGLDLSMIQLEAGESLTFLLAAFNSESSNGTLDMESLTGLSSGAGLQVTGEVSPVPLPAAAWAFLSGLLGLACISRRA